MSVMKVASGILMEKHTRVNACICCNRKRRTLYTVSHSFAGEVCLDCLEDIAAALREESREDNNPRRQSPEGY